MRYMLDTNTLIYYFKGLGAVSKRFLATPPNEIAIPVIVIYELEVGIAKSTSPRKRKAQLEELSSVVNIIPFGYGEAQWAVKIRVKLEKQGMPIGPYDVLIAATALANNSTLITHNTKEFERIEGLKIEDWY